MTDYSDYNGTWTIDPTHTRLGFVARHAMVTKVRGQFEEFGGTLVIDAANPSASTAHVTVQLASVNTGTPDRDAHLRSADFFDVENNKEMTFASTGVKQDGDEFVMLGDLTIKGVTRPVELELESGDEFFCSSDFEVHIAERIFSTKGFSFLPPQQSGWLEKFGENEIMFQKVTDPAVVQTTYVPPAPPQQA